MYFRSGVAAAGCALMLILAGMNPRAAEAQEVSYSVIPTYQEIRWDDAFGFERLRFWGVRGSFDFGPYFSLQPFYAWEDDFGPRDDLTPAQGDPSLWDMQTFGADAMVNLARGPIVPFIKGGGGVLRITPEEEDRTERILLRYGAGLRFEFGNRFGAELTAENWKTRLSSPFVADAIADEDFPDDGLVDSWVYGAGLRVPLGGDAISEDARGLVPGFAIEPFAVRTRFADEFDLPRQDGIGARAGIDFNQNVGLRAFYWRGIDDDQSDFENMEGYGAEARFALSAGPGISPFLVAGVGRITFDDEVLEEAGELPDDLDQLILGGGLSFALGDQVRAELGVRNLLMSPGEELEDVTDPDELVSNWQYSVGLSFTLGASPRPEFDRDRERQRIRQEERERLRDDELERMRAEERRRLIREEGLRPEDVDAVRPDTLRRERTMVVPVPEVGEVILRYGEAYAVRAPDAVEGFRPADLERIEQAIVDALGQRIDDLENLEARLPEIVRQIVREELRAMGMQPGVRPDPTPDPRRDPDLEPVDADFDAFRWQPRRLEPHTGLQVHDGVQFLVATRADLGYISRDLPIEVIPEVAFGFGGGGTSLLLGANGRYTWDLGGDRNYAPYGQLGLALTNQRLISVNAGYGLKFDVADLDDGRRTRMFVEHQGLQLYRDHRLLVGLSLSR